MCASADPTLKQIYGAVHFRNPGYEIFKVLGQVNSDRLIHEIVSMLEESPPLERLDWFPPDRFPQLFEHVDHVWTTGVVDDAPLWWAAHLQSGVLRDPADAINAAIVVKSTKARSYDWRGSEMRWLVVAAPGRGVRDCMPLYSGASHRTPEIEIPFSRIFLFARGLGGWYVLQLHPTIVRVPYGSKLASSANGI
jgi:hypothetical protein